MNDPHSIIKAFGLNHSGRSPDLLAPFSGLL
jgi:hypothetical protein